jgi:hypothetical protein
LFNHVCIGDVFGLLSIPSLLVSELNPQATRSLIATIFATVSQLLNLLQFIGFPPLYAGVGSYAYLPILIIECLCLIVLWHYLPETKGRAIDEIVRHMPTDLHWTHHEQQQAVVEGERTPLIGSLALGADADMRTRRQLSAPAAFHYPQNKNEQRYDFVDTGKSV